MLPLINPLMNGLRPSSIILQYISIFKIVGDTTFYKLILVETKLENIFWHQYCVNNADVILFPCVQQIEAMREEAHSKHHQLQQAEKQVMHY